MINIIRGLQSYIYINGYTNRSFAKKCNIEYNDLSLLLNEYKSLDPLKVKDLLSVIMDIEGITEDTLYESIHKKAEHDLSVKLNELQEINMFKSRDIARIKPFLEELEMLWCLYPDLRFGQLFSILASDLTSDPFYVEDNIFMDVIKKKILE